MACNPEMPSLVLEKFEILVSSGPGLRTYRDSWKDSAFVFSDCRRPVSVPVSIRQKPRVFWWFSRKILPRNRLYRHSADLNLTKPLPWKENRSLQV